MNYQNVEILIAHLTVVIIALHAMICKYFFIIYKKIRVAIH